MTVSPQTRRKHNRILVLAVEAAQKQMSAWRTRDRWEWIMARWPVGLGHECTGRASVACTDVKEWSPSKWCRACVESASLVAAYEGLAPPSWRVRSPERASGACVVRVRVDGATPSGMRRNGQAQTTKLLKDGRCRTCKGTGCVILQDERRYACTVCDGTGGRRFSR